MAIVRTELGSIYTSDRNGVVAPRIRGFVGTNVMSEFWDQHIKPVCKEDEAIEEVESFLQALGLVDKYLNYGWVINK